MLEYKFFDRVHAWTFNPQKLFNMVPGSQFLEYRMNIRNAERFILNDGIVDDIVQLSKNLDLVKTYINLAKLPFDKTWIEFDQLERLRSVQRHSDVMFEFNENEISKACGLLFERLSKSSWRVTEFAYLENDEANIATKLVDIIFDEAATEENSLNDYPHSISKEFGLSPGIEYVPLGISDKSKKENHIIVPEWANHKFTAKLNPLWRPAFKIFKQRNEHRYINMLSNEMNENRGFSRFLLTALAMMYKAPIETVRYDAAKGSKIVGMNKVRYLSCSVVSISLPKKSRIAKIRKSLAAAYKSEFQIPVRSYQRRYTDKSTGVTRLIDVSDYVKFADMPKRYDSKIYEVK